MTQPTHKVRSSDAWYAIGQQKVDIFMRQDAVERFLHFHQTVKI